MPSSLHDTQSQPDHRRVATGDREAILGRIREALREPAPRHHDKPAAAPAGGAAVTAPFREWLPNAGDSDKARIECFARLSEMLKTEFVPCASIVAATKHLAGLATEFGWKRLATHAGELNDRIVKKLPGSLEVLRIEPGYDRDALEASDAGLTECECLVAQTGSVCVTALSSGGRTLSVLPPHHVVVARRAQMVADLTAAYELLAQKYAPNYPSFMSFITGPSRTGDIERILVLGAHGPKKLTVLLVP
jgi:L-lactate dehydrogenase complex protein LldG